MLYVRKNNINNKDLSVKKNNMNLFIYYVDIKNLLNHISALRTVQNGIKKSEVKFLNQYIGVNIIVIIYFASGFCLKCYTITIQHNLVYVNTLRVPQILSYNKRHVALC